MVRVEASGEARRVAWPLDGPSLAALLDAHLAERSLARPVATVAFDGRRAVDLARTVREALAEAGLAPDPSRAIELVVSLVAAAAGARPPMAPAAPPMAPAAPAFPPTLAKRPVSMSTPPVSQGAAWPPPPPASPASPAPSLLNYVRRATVDYFARMTVQKVFPLTVTLAPWSGGRTLAPDAARAVSDAFTVDPAKWIEVEPVLPGCAVYPAKQLVPGGVVLSELRFWVVPQVTGGIPGVVYVRNGDQQRAVRLAITVSTPRRAAWTAAAGLALPYASAVMKHYHLDFESQLGSGFAPLHRAARTLLDLVGTGPLCAALLAASLGLWLWARPRRASATESPDAPLYAT